MSFIKQRTNYAFLLFILINSSAAFGQLVSQNALNIAESISNKLEEDGLQNISIGLDKDGGRYQITYENRIYRFEPMALRRVIELSEPILRKNGYARPLELITKRNGISTLKTLVLFSKDTFQVLSITQNISSSKKLLINERNSGNYRLELVLRPFYSAEYGNLYNGDPITHLFDLRPKLNLYLWKGAHFTYEFIVPISSEFKTVAPHWSEFRNRVISLSQQFRLPYNSFLNLSAGVFSRNRYGISAEGIKYFRNSTLALTGKIGYTGHASYVRYNGREIQKGWLYTDLHYLDYKVGFHYWMPSTNTRFSVEYGRVLDNQSVVSFKMMQRFKEVNFGFFAFRTGEGNNFGMELAIPIFPKKYWQRGRFSARPSRQWSYQYLYGTNLAREYQAQGMFPEFPQDLNPHFMKFYLKN